MCHLVNLSLTNSTLDFCYVSSTSQFTKAQFRRRTSHVPYQVVRSLLAVIRCPNEFLSTDLN